ncbi:MAG TPA: DUF1259 domain-containing protein [Chthoniobacterales bacterium]|nr:DUF1259 domain-containing protein [Chthoniobacterales bacterium]
MRNLLIITLVAALSFAALKANAAELDTAKIDEITGLKGKLDEAEGVYKVTFPRDDVKVAVTGWTMPPFMGLGTWAAFQGSGDKAMMMGDTVLFEDEVNAAMSAALDNGLSVTALHNHFFFDRPKVYFMHIGGEGPVEKLAAAARKVYDSVKAVRSSSSKLAETFGEAAAKEKAALPDKSSITIAPLNEVFGMQGEAKDGMGKFTIGRKAAMGGMAIGKTMGVNTWASFAGSDENAVVDGDFAMTEDELQPVLKTLRQSGINVVAIHNHMTHESPRIMFLHYWGRGPARELAEAVKAALAKTSAAESTAGEH